MSTFELEANELAALAAECDSAFADARVDGVTQPWPCVLVLELRTIGRTRFLLLGATRGLARCHETADPPPAPRTPPRLCQFLRARLGGARLRAIDAVPGERVLRLTFEPHPESAGGVACLVAELFGNPPNLICLDAAGTIVEALHHRKTRLREIAPGIPYLPMPPRASTAAPAGRLEAERAAGGHDTLGAAADAIFGPLEAAAALAELREDLLARLLEARKRFDGQRVSLERAQAETAGAERYREIGELVKANLHAIRPGQEEARLQDFYDAELKEVIVALDPALPAMQNAERYFKKYRKAKEGRATVARRLQAAVGVLARVAEIEEAVRAATEAAALVPLDEKIAAFRTRGARRAPVVAPRKKRETGGGDEPRRFVSKEGLTILVGTNARQNDFLTFRLANGHDTWLHVEDAAGAHVVIRTERGKSAPLETLLDAATLAIHHSKFRAAGRASVTYTQRKHVSKPRGAPAGLVMVAQPRTLDVRVEPERIERLLRGDEGVSATPN